MKVVEYRDKKVYNYIAEMATLTGKIEVKFTSGTGVIMSIDKVDDSKFEIFVLTASHIIKDTKEARAIKLILFYDDDNTTNTVKLDGLRVIDNDLTTERSIVVFSTNNSKIVEDLFAKLENLLTLEKKIIKNYSHSRGDRLAAVVSHPHGWCKCVSLGIWIHKELHELSEKLVRYSYTATTCNGSSGAAVFILGERFPRISEHFLATHVHKGNGKSCLGFNHFL